MSFPELKFLAELEFLGELKFLAEQKPLAELKFLAESKYLAELNSHLQQEMLLAQWHQVLQDLPGQSPLGQAQLMTHNHLLHHLVGLVCIQCIGSFIHHTCNSHTLHV